MKKFIFTLTRKIDDLLYRAFTKRIRIAFHYSNDIGLNCQLPIIELALQYPNKYAVYIFSDNENKLESSPLIDDIRPLIISYKKAQTTKFSFIITTDVSTFYLKRNYQCISISHGAAFGNSNWDIVMYEDEVTDIHFALSEQHKTRCLTESKTINKDIYSIGFPKLDNLVNGQFNKEVIAKKLGISQDKPTILIASHWTECSILAQLGINLIQTIADKYPQYNVIQTAHDKIWTNPEYKEGALNSDVLKESLLNLEKSSDNIYFVPTSNIHELLAIADVFITDISSVIVEFSVMDKPILFFDLPQQSFANEHTYSLYKNASTPFVSTNDAISAINEALINDKTKQPERSMLKKHFLCNVGTAAKAALQQIDKMAK